MFPLLGLNISAVKNRAVFWYNVDVNGIGDPRTLHAGAPVLQGVKYGLNIWIDESQFET